MRRYSHAFRVLMDQELFNLLAEASTKTGIPKSRFVRYAIQPFSYTELAPGTTDWNDVYRTDPDPEHPLKRGRQLNVMLTGEHPSCNLAKGRMGRIVDRCTHVNPQRRYKNVLRLMEAL